MAALGNEIINNSSTTIHCPACKEDINVVETQKSIYFSCSACGTFFERVDFSLNTLRKFKEEDRCEPTIPLGTTGIIDGYNYTLTGFIRKKQTDDDIYWNEYTFATPGDSWYIIFAEYDGNWMMIWRSENQNIHVEQSISGEYYAIDTGKRHLLYLVYKYNIIDAVGEFDWNILKDEELTTYEYATPPSLLINEERDDNEANWFNACYVSPKQLIDYFKIDPARLPKKNAFFSFNPSKFYPKWKPFMYFTGITIMLLILINAFIAVMKPEKEVFNNTFECQPDTISNNNSKAIISPAFQITGSAPVYFTIRANGLSNSWIQMQIELINDSNGKVYEIEKTIEYYDGYDDGEHWEEGEKKQTALLSNIPSGTYHLNIYPATEYSKSTETGSNPVFSLSVKQNVFLSLNFFITLTLILIYPCIQLVRKYLYENSKWFDKEYGSLPKN